MDTALSNAGIAQLGERMTEDHKVVRSIRTNRIHSFFFCKFCCEARQYY